MLIMGDWKHPYPAAVGAYPAAVASGSGTGAAVLGLGARRAKYWPPVRRIDQAYGDRNLVCACPSPEAFE
jgi:glycine dehydrogenase